MRMRTMAAAVLAAATLTIGGSAAAYASAPAPPPPGAKGTVKVFSCQDGVIKLEETHLVDGEHGVAFSLPDGEVAAGSAHPRVHVMRAVPADGPSDEGSGADGSTTDVLRAGAVPARPLPDGAAGVMVTRVAAGAGVPFVEPKEGEPCSALAVPALPALPTQSAK